MRHEDQRQRERDLAMRLGRLSTVLMLGFLAIGMALLYWSVIRAPSILAREDNPRLVEAELRIQRGRILDRDGRVLAETTGPSDQLQRSYPSANSGPAVGYYSFRHGTAGIEESYDDILRGGSPEFWLEFQRRTLHKPQVGRDVQLTINSDLQELSGELLANERGAILLLSLPEAEIVTMVSHPGYDPNQLDANFQLLTGDEDAPLLNRATQGLYQPGMVLAPFLLASAVDQERIHLDDLVEDATAPVWVDEVETTCAASPNMPTSWRDVLSARCPSPMAELASAMGPARLGAIFSALGFTAAPALPINTETADSEPVVDAMLAGIGQESLTVTPLQIALAWSALGGDGRLPSPRLVKSVEDEEGVWQPLADGPGFTGTALSPSAASELRQALTPENDVVRFSSLVMSGPEGNQHAWFLGLTPVESPQFAVVVVVEDSATVDKAESIGMAILDVAYR